MPFMPLIAFLLCAAVPRAPKPGKAGISRNKREGHYAGKWARGAWYGGDPVKHHRSHSVELMLRTHRKGVFSGFREP